ncbi:sulfite exporter TauE/SafE family protein, partial [Candidatus Regiella insecticola]|uniref:sulfite exporter TauE/SafE family protein n=1 Tax=Candidatus Regiella insecticola TaxID=138073 RepID=UPI0009DA4D8C
LILIPVFLMIGLPPHFALGQEKLVSTVGTLSAIRNFIKSSAIVWAIVPTGIFFALLGAFIGAKAILWLPTDSIHYVILVMLPIGLFATLKGKKQDTNSEEAINEVAIKKSLLVASLVCLLVGFYDGFFGPGAGSFFIIALCLLNNMTLLKASATAKIFNFSSNIGAFVAFLMAGQMAFTIGCPMMIASLLGNHLGSLHAIKSDGKIIKKVLMLTVTSMMIYI